MSPSASLSYKTGARAALCAGGEPRYRQLAREYLRERGVVLEEFEAAGCEVVPDARRIDSMYPNAPALVFNFYHPLTREPLAYSDEHGRGTPFQRVKPLGIRGAKFMQPRNSGTHVFFAAHPTSDLREFGQDASYGAIFSEGETRALAGAVRDLAVIAITGVDCGQVNGELHPDLLWIDWRGREVYFAFDSDVSRKSGPQHALQKLGALLRQRGAKVFEVSIPHAPDGSKQGLDDFLARYGADAFKALLQSSETRPAPGAEIYEPPVFLGDIMAAEYPPTEWAWANLVLKGEVNLLYGDGGVGKSLLALYSAVAVAAGRLLFGEATMQMPVLGLFAEDGAAQVQQRSTTALKELGLDAHGNLPIKFWCQPREETLLARIDDNGNVTELPRLHALRAELAAIGRSAMLIVDSMADLFALNESLRLPVNAALKQVLGGLCRDYGTTVLVLAHPSKTSMQDGTNYSGSTAFNNAVRQRLTLEIIKREVDDATDGPPLRRLSVAKSNYGQPVEKTLWFYGTTIADVPRAAVATPAEEKAAVLATMLRLIDSGIRVVRSNGNGQKFRDVAAAVREQHGVSISAASVGKHVGALEREGLLTYQQRDRNARPYVPSGFVRGLHSKLFKTGETIQ
jgi:AAA domain/Domain of unknown function (DUF3854)